MILVSIESLDDYFLEFYAILQNHTSSFVAIDDIEINPAENCLGSEY